MVPGGEHREHADAVGDEVGRVLGAHHALAERGDEEGFQLVEQWRFGFLAGNQLDEVHVARRVEEVDAAEAVAQMFGESCAELVDRQAGGVAREDGAFAEIGRDLAVQVGLPVDALGDRLDDQVAVAQFFQMLPVVGGFDECGLVRRGERRGIELFQVLDGLAHVRVRITLLRGQLEQQRLDIGIDQMRGDLRAHHPCAEHRDLAYLKILAHSGLLVIVPLRIGFGYILCALRPLCGNDTNSSRASVSHKVS